MFLVLSIDTEFNYLQFRQLYRQVQSEQLANNQSFVKTYRTIKLRNYIFPIRIKASNLIFPTFFKASSIT